jgi:hypothetical protein
MQDILILLAHLLATIAKLLGPDGAKAVVSHRVHTALDSYTPSDMSGETANPGTNLSDFRWKSHRLGLYQLPVAA